MRLTKCFVFVLVSSVLSGCAGAESGSPVPTSASPAANARDTPRVDFLTICGLNAGLIWDQVRYAYDKKEIPNGYMEAAVNLMRLRAERLARTDSWYEDLASHTVAIDKYFASGDSKPFTRKVKAVNRICHRKGLGYRDTTEGSAG